MSATENKQLNGGFDALLGELDTMTKALPAATVADDNKTAVTTGEPENKEGQVEQPLTKALQVTLPDGSVVEAEDGTELVKSLFARLDGQEDLMVKALGGTLNLVKAQGAALAEQGALIKSLQAEVAKIGNQPAGRKTLLTVHEQVNTLTKSLGQEQAAPTGAEIMTKANAAYDAKKISGQELNEISVAIRQRQPIENSLLAKAMG